MWLKISVSSQDHDLIADGLYVRADFEHWKLTHLMRYSYKIFINFLTIFLIFLKKSLNATRNYKNRKCQNSALSKDFGRSLTFTLGMKFLHALEMVLYDLILDHQIFFVKITNCSNIIIRNNEEVLYLLRRGDFRFKAPTNMWFCRRSNS